MKFIMCHMGILSYSARKVLVQYIKSQTGEKFRRYFYLHSQYYSGDATTQTIHTPNNKSEELKENKKQKRELGKTQKLKISEDIYSEMKKVCPLEVLNAVPKRYFRRHRISSEQVYLVDTNVADTIVQCIRNDVLKEGAIVSESNPGTGILSKSLLDAGVKHLHLHEPTPTFHKIIKNLHSSRLDKITLHFSDLFSLWKVAYQDKMDGGTRVQDILSHYPKKNWTEEPALKIIGCIGSLNCIKHLIFSLIYQRGLMMHCRPEFYVIVQPSLHLTLTSSRKDGYNRYRNLSVLFQLFFDFELLEKVPRKAFLPWPVSRLSRSQRIEEVVLLGDKQLYLMKIVPKKDLYEMVPADKLTAFWYFVRHHFIKRSSRVIPEMESWIPGCGVHLILEGYNIFTEFGDLRPKDVLNIFKQFSSWPEFQDCYFLSSMEATLLKLDEHSDIGDKNKKSIMGP